MFTLLPDNIQITKEQLTAQLAAGGRPWITVGRTVRYMNDDEFNTWKAQRAKSVTIDDLDRKVEKLFNSCQERMMELSGDSYKAGLVAALALTGNQKAGASLKWINETLWGNKKNPVVNSYFWRKKQLMSGKAISYDFTSLGRPPFTFDQIMGDNK